MTAPLKSDNHYVAWLKELKAKVRQVQLSAALKVNQEMLFFYWDLGEDILERQKTAVWGDGFLAQLSRDLSAEFPDMKGFSKRNLELIRQWRAFWTGHEAIAKQLATQIPWWHNVVIFTKIKAPQEARFYLQKTLEHGWSRAVLTHQIEGGLYHREGKAVTNFPATLPKPQSDLAQQTINDPYNFDFLTLRAKHDEKELNFYVSAVDGLLKTAQDNPTMGILICKSKNKTVVEYALKDVHKPIGVSEYTLTQSLPEAYKSSLPTTEEIEAELEGQDG